MQPAKRPIGVSLSAYVLVAVACVEFVLLIFTLLGIVLTLNGGIYFGSPPRRGWVETWDIAIAILLLCLILWSSYTIAGLLRGKKWARHSILLKGSVLATCAGWAVLDFVIDSKHRPPVMFNRETLHQNLFSGMFFVYAALFAIGMSWLAYFNSPGVKLYFLNKQQITTFPSQGGPDTVEP